MTKLPCELIEDILPLYLENDVNATTKNLIDEHLLECKDCQSLIDEYKVDEPIKSQIETLPKTDTFKQWMIRLKRTVFASLIFFIIIGITIGGLSYNAGKSNSYNTHILYAKSMKDVRDYFYEKTPGLQRAETEGNVQEINEDIQIPKDKGTLTLDKIWYTTKNIYVFYHINGDIPTYVDGSIKWSNGESSMNFYNGEMNLGEGIVQNGIYYSRISFGNKDEMKNKHENNFEKNSQIKLNLHLALNYEEFGQDENQIELPNTSLTVNFDRTKEQTYHMNLNGTVDVGKYGQLVFNGLNMNATDSFITFDYKNDTGYQIQYLAGTLTTDIGDERKLWVPLSPTGKDSPYYRLDFKALDSMPNSVSIRIDGMKIVTKKNISFEIPVENYHGHFQNPVKEEGINKKIGTVDGVDIYLHRVWWRESGLSFELLQKSEQLQQVDSNHPLNRISTSNIYPIYLAQSLNQREGYKDWLFPNVVTVYDEYETQMENKYYGQRGGGSEETIFMEINKSFVESTDKVSVNLANVSYKIFGPWSGEIQVDSK